MEVGCMTFGMKRRKKPKNTPEITVYKAGMMWRFKGRLAYIPEDIWGQYIQHVMSERFTRRSQSGADNRN